MNQLSNRQIEIIEVAVKLISKKGIQNLTIKNLAGKIGITEPGIYRHFKNKEEILSTILTYFKHEMHREVSASEMPGQSGTNLLPILEKMFLQNIDTLSKHPFFSFILFSEEIFQNNRRIFRQIISIMKEQESVVFELVQKAQKNGELRKDIPAENIAHILLASIRFSIQKWYFSNFTFDLKAEHKKLWTSLRKIIIKK